MDFGQHFADNLIRGHSKRIRQVKLTEAASYWLEGINLPNLSLGLDWLRLNTWRELILILLGGLGFLVLVSRLFTLQIIRGKENLFLSQENQVYRQNIPAPRGVIYDRNGVVLARNVLGYRAQLTYARLPSDANRREAVLRLVKQLLGLNDKELEDVLAVARRVPFKSFDLKKNLAHSEQLSLQSREQDLPGISVAKTLLRSYPAGKYFSSVLGYMGALSASQLGETRYAEYSPLTWVGKAGLEAWYEKRLHGIDGEEQFTVSASGRKGTTREEVAPRPGENLRLTLDADLQKKAGSLLEKAIQKYGATGGVFVALEPKKGGVLAMVSLPTYDNNIFAHGGKELKEVLADPRGLLVNRAIAGQYPPGSTIKPAVAAAALQEGLIDSQTKISDKPQVIRVGAWEFPDWTVSWGRAAHGWLNVQQAIAQSCDTFFYKIGGGFPPNCRVGNAQKQETSLPECQVEGLGIGRLSSYLERFGLGKKTGIDLPGEASGLVPNPEWKKRVKQEDWFLGNTYHLSIGQGDLLVTPLQIAYLTNTIASYGRSVKPHLNLTAAESELTDLPVYRKYIEEVRRGMRLGVTQGIVYPLRQAKVSVAAKTGTAEFGRKNARGEWETHAWVAGFAPYENPEITFVLLLEGGGKSSHAAEAAREIIDWYFSREAGS